MIEETKYDYEITSGRPRVSTSRFSRKLYRVDLSVNADARKRHGARASRTGFPNGWRPEFTLRDNGKDYSISEWNKLFERQDPNAEQDDE